MTFELAAERRVLVVEDEADLRELLTYNLEAAGFTVHAADRGLDGLAEAQGFAPDVVLLDLMLPDIPGAEVCRRIRASERSVPQPAIVMLTAKGDEIDRVVGFELGADDYVVKPFSMRELVLRVNAILRARRSPGAAERSGSPTARRRYVVGPLEVDADRYHVFVSGEEVHVSAMEMRLLIYLMEHRGRARSREDLLGDVWGYKPDISTRTVDTHVKRLRDKLGPAGSLVETVRGMGYRLSAEHSRSGHLGDAGGEQG